MENNNWQPAQGGEPTLDTGDWRTGLQPDSRQRIVNKIMETLKRHLPVSGQEGIHELQKIAQRFEEKIYTAATSQSDYLRKISLKMLTMESKSQPNTANPLPSNSGGNSSNLPDPGLGMQSQVHNQGQSLPIPLANQSHSRQQLLPQNIQNSMTSAGVQNSAGLPSRMQSLSGLTQTPIPNVAQNSDMQNMAGASQNIGTSMGQGVPSNLFSNSQRQLQARQQVIPQQQQQQQQSQNQQQYLYQQQLQQQLLKQKFQQGNIPPSVMQSHIHQQQQQNLLQPNQLQPSQQSVMQTSSVMQPSMTQSSSLPSIQPNQQFNNVQQSTQSMLQQHPQSVLRQQQQSQQNAVVHQNQTPGYQQSMLLPQQQSNATTMLQIGQQSSVGDMQQQQRLLGQQNNLANMHQHQHQQQHQQQLLNLQNNPSNIHQQQLGSNVTGLQQQQQQHLLGTQSGNSSIQTNKHSVHMLQQANVSMQQQNASNLLPSQGQQVQPQSQQQQLMPRIQSHSAQLQQQLSLQQQPNPLQRDMQQRIQGSGSSPLLQQQNVLDQQKQLYLSQRALPETSPTSLDSTAQTGQINGGDWQEEVFQKINTMKETYIQELNDMHGKIVSKLGQQDSLPQQTNKDQLEKLRIFKAMLERIIAFLQVPKSNILPNFKDKLGAYEKQIENLLSTNKSRRLNSSLQQGQLPPSHMHSKLQPQSQVTQVQSHENQMNSQLQATNLQGSVASTQNSNTMTNLQHIPMSSIAGVSTLQQNMRNSLLPGANMGSGQGNGMNSLQQVSVGSLQQNPASTSQQTNINPLTSQPNLNPLQPSSNMLQHQHLKQQQEQQMLQNQQLKQHQQRQMQQQLMQRQQMLQQQQQQKQQLHQQAKQQLPTQVQSHQMPQLHQINDINEMKMRQGTGVKLGTFPQHLSSSQRSMKSGAQFPVSSPQLLQAVSPQIPQHSSPQVDQQNLLPSLTKVGTPLQSTNSPFVVPTSSPPLAPSPMPGDFEKPISGASALTNAGTIAHQQTGGGVAPTPSLAIGTPGISASPLLAEFTGPDGAHGNALTAAPGKSSVTEQPIERLIRAVKSMSHKALTASVTDIGSIVMLTDRIAGSAPGNGSRAAIGEDLAAMTKCRLLARNIMTQDGTDGSKKMRHYTSFMPLNVVSSARSLIGSETSDLDTTATSIINRSRIKANHALSEEIRQINQRLIDTVVDISEEDVDQTVAAVASEGSDGSVVKCSYIGVALSPDFETTVSLRTNVANSTPKVACSN
ncbi:mediator of RNA polymerase II transcription subunit 15a-like [Quillaja saponaria]|uniref:Mediator of RNA polymerase II transcription subunit 15a-like n=1 Tax=Quillaja saponaria TaxID=32244 RepID=A0AAD7PPI3_QUISA|nr:mediator of RNA polymerase II transcription subunit 15a-like [Quillaja saponaria]